MPPEKRFSQKFFYRSIALMKIALAIDRIRLLFAAFASQKP